MKHLLPTLLTVLVALHIAGCGDVRPPNESAQAIAPVASTSVSTPPTATLTPTAESTATTDPTLEPTPTSTVEPVGEGTPAQVTNIVDGDTIDVLINGAERPRSWWSRLLGRKWQ
jgi:cytoskeletal protein RodZ